MESAWPVAKASTSITAQDRRAARHVPGKLTHLRPPGHGLDRFGQSAATSEIARNVQQTSQAAREVTMGISSVSQAASETGAAAGEVLTAE